MAQHASTSAAQQGRTVFLIPSIHCPTCTSFMETLLLGLDAKIRTVETSIVNHTVTVHHEATLDIQDVVDSLVDAGYEVDDVISESLSTDPHESRGPADDNFPFSWVNRTVGAWGRRGQNQDSTGESRRRHAEHCKQCRDDMSSVLTLQGTPSPEAKPGFVVIDTSSELSKVYRATLSVDGMSCSSCVGKITETLDNKSWVKTANVSLLARSATVEFYEGHDVGELAAAIEDLGYDATVEEVEEVAQEADSYQTEHQATFSIGGMTCNSCVGSITRSLDGKPWIKSISVNLLTHSATAVFIGRDHVDDIVAEIESLGYEASLDTIVDLSKRPVKDSRRNISVRIDGLYCQHCPDKVTQALEAFGNRITIDKEPTLNKPIVSFSYQPDAPEFTIRTILSAIAAVDETFSPTIYHPPTIEERSRRMLARTRRRLFYRVLLSFIVAIPSLIIGIVYMNLVSPNNSGRRYLSQTLAGVTRFDWALLIMATPVYFFAADVFHRRTIKELYALWRPGSTTPLPRRFYRFGSMDMLVSFATSVAYFSSIAEIAIGATSAGSDHMTGMSHLDSVVFLTLFLLIGRLIEAYSKAKTGEAVTKLGSLRPKEALLITPDATDGGSDQVQSIATDMVDTGDLVRVVHGGSPPWDGILTAGEAEFVEASLTGESKPVKKALGDSIYAGTINKGGPVTMRITGAAGDSLLDQIIKVVREGQARRAPIERVADSITSYFVPIVTLLAIVTWLTWLGLGMSGRLPDDYLSVTVGGWPFWSLQFAIAVFVIACPCGIGLAAPTALFVGGGLAAQHGILAKGGGEAFQEASRLDIIVFDKTGTLTEGGEPKLTNHRFLSTQSDVWTEATILGCLKEMESNSSHPIGKAVVAFCESRDTTPAKAGKMQEIPGKGMKAVITVPSFPAPVEVIVGNEAMMSDHGITLDDAALDELDLWKEQAKSVVLASTRSERDSAWTVVAMFATSDPLRPEAAPVIEALHKQGMDVWMLSGDNAKTANAVGAMVGIPADRVIAGVLPEQKADQVKFLQQRQIITESRLFGLVHGKTRRPVVAMVGDGINDSPALTMADVGVAIGSGSDVAISAAAFVLINSSLDTLLTLTSLSRAVFRRVKFNFAWAMVYNLIALPIAAGVIYPIKSNGSYTRLDPAWAALAMALSSLSVICSSLLLRSKIPFVGYRGGRN